MKEDNLDFDDSNNNELINEPETISKISEIIFPIIKTKEEVKILTEFYKQDYKDIDLTLCIDTSLNNNTILISLVYYNLTNVILNILLSFSKIYKSSPNFISYINQKNSKGYNALLYSAFRGNLEIFKKLMELGANISETNSSGLNALHLAVQGNHPNIIVYLIEKCGFDINSKDIKISGNNNLNDNNNDNIEIK
jgi:ankyrin repeat protein